MSWTNHCNKLQLTTVTNHNHVNFRPLGKWNVTDVSITVVMKEKKLSIYTQKYDGFK
jgi:hypothetical protein